MPFYVYRCSNEECEDILEVRHGRNDPSPAGEPCKTCGTGEYRRLLTAAPFKFVTPGMQVTHMD